MTLLGSASKLHRSIPCPASVHLPAGRELPERVLEAGRRGTGLHTYSELLPTKGETVALAAIPERFRKEAANTNWAHYPGMHPHAKREMAFAHHGQTGEVRVLGESIGREYEVTDQYETPGTADVVIAGYKTVEVYDLKTGRSPVPAAGENPQLLHLALCAVESVAPYAEQVVVGIATLDKGVVRVTNQATVTRDDLAAHEQRVVQAQRVALRVIDAIKAGLEPEKNPGAHCKYCDAKCEYAK